MACSGRPPTLTNPAELRKEAQVAAIKDAEKEIQRAVNGILRDIEAANRKSVATGRMGSSFSVSSSSCAKYIVRRAPLNFAELKETVDRVVVELRKVFRDADQLQVLQVDWQDDLSGTPSALILLSWEPKVEQSTASAFIRPDITRVV